MITLFSLLSQIDIGKSYNPPFYNDDPKQGIKGVGSLVSVILSNVYILAGVVLLILFLWAGFKMIQSAGTRDSQKAAEAKSTLTYAVIGFLIIFASYWIIQIVEAITGLTIL